MPDINSVIIILILLIPLPFLAGGLFIPYGKNSYPGGVEDRLLFKLIHLYVLGLILELALFELVALVDIPSQRSMTTLSRHYDILFFAAAILGSIRIVWHYFSVMRKREKKKVKTPKLQILCWTALFLLLGIQIYYFVTHQHLDGDDSYYVAQSLLADKTGDLYLRDPYTGYVGALDGRHAMAALPVFIAWLSRHCGIHTTIIAHSIMGPFFLTLMYLIYTLLGARLLRDKKDYIPLFVFIVGLWYVNSNVSLFTAETFAYTRTWQGKAVFGNICIPLSLIWLYDIFKKENKSAVFLALTSVMSVLATTASVFLLGILLGMACISLGLYKLIKEKSFKKAVISVLPVIAGMIPLLIAGVIYIKL